MSVCDKCNVKFSLHQDHPECDLRIREMLKQKDELLKDAVEMLQNCGDMDAYWEEKRINFLAKLENK